MANYTVTTTSNAGDDQTVSGDLAAETADGGGLSLQEALILSQGNADATDSVSFNAALSGGTVTLTSSLGGVSDTVTIDGDINGDDKADIIIDAGGNAGHVDVSSGGTLTLNSLTLTGSSGNSAVDVHSGGTLYANQSTFSGNSTGGFGGAIYSRGDVTLNDSTVSGNTAAYGGGFYLRTGSSLTATNTTIHGNTITGGYGGGVFVGFGVNVNLINSTVTGNSSASVGGGISSTGTLNLTNTIVLGNTAPNSPDIASSGTINDNGGNVTSGTPANVFASLTGAGGTLADNGGPVQTVALLNNASNPALDVGPSALATDARGEARFDFAGVDNDPVGSDFADSGAYELQCFAPGTLIATSAGERTVETLAIGDLVRTADGRDVPVKWLGRQSVVTRLATKRQEPVRLRAGALGDGLPHSDLTVTADHGMLIDGMVINASALVNGHSIDWVPLSELPSGVTFYHIETDDHDVIRANGAPTESYVDLPGRSGFDNYREYLDLYGAERIILEMNRPRISSRRLLPEAIKARLRIVEPQIAWDAPLSA